MRLWKTWEGKNEKNCILGGKCHEILSCPPAENKIPFSTDKKQKQKHSKTGNEFLCKYDLMAKSL